jgi:hypothetical protein
MDYVIAPNDYRFPDSRDEQIKLILHGSVSEAIYRIRNQTPQPFTDYAKYFTVSYDDLVGHLLNHKAEFDSILPTSSWDGMSVVKEGDNYLFRWHDRGNVIETRRVETTDEAVSIFLSEWLLLNQGLQAMIPK